ncbi:hypothetical protein AAK967_03540 [Atopobiaceae bacterium 24-176]
MHTESMGIVLCDLDAWTLFASRAPLHRVPKEEADRALERATCTAADVAFVRALPWRRELEGHIRVLAGAAPEDDVPVHLAASDDKARHRAKGLVAHRMATPLAEGSLCSANEGVLTVSPELYVLMRSRILSPGSLAVVVSLLCGRYSPRFDDPDGCAVQCGPVTTVARIREFAEHCEGLWFSRTNVNRVLDCIADGSRSPMETALNGLLCLPERDGGYGLPKPTLNSPIYLSRNEVFAMRGQRRCEIDLLWPDCQVGLEYDGGGHFDSREAMEQDRLRDALMKERGLDIVRWTWPMVADEVALDLKVRDLARKLGVKVSTGPFCNRLVGRRALRAFLLGRHLVW